MHPDLEGAAPAQHPAADADVIRVLDNAEHLVQSLQNGGFFNGSLTANAASFIRFLSGSHSAVVGLPLFETAQLLRGHGWQVP